MDYFYYLSKMFVSTPYDPLDDSGSSSDSTETKPDPKEPTKIAFPRGRVNNYFNQVISYKEKQRELSECGTGTCFVSNIEDNYDHIYIKVDLINRSAFEVSKGNKSKIEQRWSFNVKITENGFESDTLTSMFSRHVYTSFNGILQDLLTKKAVHYPKNTFTISPTRRPEVMHVTHVMQKYFGKPLDKFDYDIVKISRACLGQMGVPSPHSLYFIKQSGVFEPYWLSSSCKELGSGSFKSIKELSHAFTNKSQALFVGGVNLSNSLSVKKHKIEPFEAYYDLLDKVSENPEEASHLAVPKIQHGRVYESSKESQERVFMLQEVLYKDLIDFPSGDFPLDQFFSLLEQMVISIQQLHAFGFFHSDVKLDNFMVTQKANPHLVLIDYDSLKYIDTEVNHYVTSGTLDYLPRCCFPDFAKLRGEYGPKLDIFALITSMMSLSYTFLENTKIDINSSLDPLRELTDYFESFYTLGNLYSNYISRIVHYEKYEGLTTLENHFLMQQEAVDTYEVKKELNDQALFIVESRLEELSNVNSSISTQVKYKVIRELTKLLTEDLLMNLPTLNELSTLIQEHKERSVEYQ